MKFKWKYVEQRAFEYIMKVVAHNNLLSYEYLNKRFKINNNAIDLQLGVGIIEERKAISIYIRKRTGPQNFYSIRKVTT